MIRHLAFIALVIVIIRIVSGLSSDKVAAPQTSVTGQQPDSQVLGSAAYNPDAVGVLPLNHDNFEKPATFGSDVTNINQFYRSNPEVFHGKARVNVPNPADWDSQASAMFSITDNAPQGPINAYNYGNEGHPLL